MNIKNILTKYPKPMILATAVLIGLALIYLSDSQERKERVDITGASSELETYGTALEKKLEEIVEHIDGSGDATVMITFETSFEKVYANNAKVQESGNDSNAFTDRTTEKEIVLAGSGTSAESPVLLKELCPRVEGVAVICSGNADKDTERKIKDAAVSLFGISELKVYVTKGENNNRPE